MMSTTKFIPFPPRQVRVPSGPLGLAMGNIPGSGGAVVVAVNPVNASVVQVSPGDQITAIDGEDVSQLNSYDVTTILNKKRDSERVLTLLYSPQILPLLKSPTPTDDRDRKRKLPMEPLVVASKVPRIGGSNTVSSTNARTRTPRAVTYSTNALARTSPSLGQELEASTATLIPAVARRSSEYDSSALDGNENTINVTQYAEQFLSPYSTLQTLYEETPQNKWLDRAFLSFLSEETIRSVQDALELIRSFEREFVDACVASGVSESTKSHVQRWNEKFEQLLDYIIKNGHSNASRDTSLGRWVAKMRYQRNNGTLSEPRIEQLDAVGFDWGEARGPQGPRGPNIHFDERLPQLQIFFNSHGHANVPQSDPILGRWVNHIREQRNNGTLRKARIDQLAAMGFDWGRGANTPFEERLPQLHKFIVDNGHAYVPQKDPLLGRWVNSIRRQRKDGTLSKDRFDQLDAMGFIWDARDYRWKIMYNELCAYKDQYKTTKVEKKRNPKLYGWCVYQREMQNLVVDEDGNSALDEERFKLLDDIGFDWYKRERSKKVTRIEAKLMHELEVVLEEFDYEWFSLDKAFGGLRYRPDGVILVLSDSLVIFVEVDERAHDPSQPSYTLEKEQTRMWKLKDEAMKDDDVDSAVFIRINTGHENEVSQDQVQTVNSVLDHIHSTKPKGYHVYYVDYDDDHAHVEESRKEASGFCSVRTFHT